MDERTPQELVREVRDARAEVARDIQELQSKAEGALKELPRAAKRTSLGVTLGVGAAAVSVAIIAILGRSHTPHRRAGRAHKTSKRVLLTVLLGVVFLGLKFSEYAQKWNEHEVPGLNFQPDPAKFMGVPPQKIELFLCFYFFMTGLHALHMIVGIGVLTVMAILSWRGKVSAEHYNRIEVSGLYWHFVDIIWIYLFPLLYLITGTRH